MSTFPYVDTRRQHQPTMAFDADEHHVSAAQYTGGSMSASMGGGVSSPQRRPAPLQVYDDRPNLLTDYLVSWLEIATESLKNVVNHSPYAFKAAVLGYAVGMIPAVGAAPAVAAFALTAHVVHSAIEPAIRRLVDDRNSLRWNLAVVVVTTAAVTLGVAAALGLTIPTAKAFVAAATVTALVKYAQHWTGLPREDSTFREAAALYDK